MNLPITKNSLIFWLDSQFILKDSNNKVTSASNKATDSLILTENSTTSPLWADNIVNGYPALIFNGAQNLYGNLPVNASSIGAIKPLILTIVSKIESYNPVFTLMSIKDQFSATPKQYINGGTIGVGKIGHNRMDNAGALDSNNLYPLDNNWHVITGAFDGTSLKLRVDGVEVDNINISNSTGLFSGTKITIGSIGAGAGGFTGKVAEAVAYTSGYGTSLNYTHESYLKQKYGI